MGKLEALAEHAKHVRKTKGSTPAASTVFAEAKKASLEEPVQFDMPVRSPGPMPDKSPVQIRLEERTAALSVVDVCDAAYDEAEFEQKLLDAGKRKQDLTAAKVSAASEKNRKAAEMALQAREVKAATLAALEAKSVAKVEGAESRRESLLAEQVDTNAQHFQKAMLLSAKKKEVLDSAKKDTQEKLVDKMTDAESRRALFMEERRSPSKLSPTKENNNKSLASPITSPRALVFKTSPRKSIVSRPPLAARPSCQTTRLICFLGNSFFL